MQLKAQSNHAWALSNKKLLAEFEGTLDISKTMSTLAQSEACSFAAAYGPALKSTTLHRLQKDELRVVDTAILHAVLAQTRIKIISELQMSETWQHTALNRARFVEAERRWCGNTSEVVVGCFAANMSDREQIAILLDSRILKGSGLTLIGFAAGEQLLEEAYIGFGKRALMHEIEKEEREATLPSTCIQTATPHKSMTLQAGSVHELNSG